MLPPKKEKLFKEKQSTNKQELENFSTEKIHISNNLLWQESISKQIDRISPVIAEKLSAYLIPVIEKLAEKLAVRLNHLSELRALQQAYENQWILSTSQLSNLLHLEPRVILRYRRFEQHGFVFYHSKKMLSETGWRIEKSSYGFDEDY